MHTVSREIANSVACVNRGLESRTAGPRQRIARARARLYLKRHASLSRIIWIVQPAHIRADAVVPLWRGAIVVDRAFKRARITPMRWGWWRSPWWRALWAPRCGMCSTRRASSGRRLAGSVGYRRIRLVRRAGLRHLGAGDQGLAGKDRRAAHAGFGAPAAAIGYGVGRIGCFLSGDGCYGIASSRCIFSASRFTPGEWPFRMGSSPSMFRSIRRRFTSSERAADWLVAVVAAGQAARDGRDLGPVPGAERHCSLSG